MINTIINDDCAKFTASLPQQSIDLIVTSPPYDNLREYNGYTFDFETIATELVRVIKPGGVIVWIVGDAVINGSETGNSFRQALYFQSLGLKIHDTMIYEKNSSTFPARVNGNRYTQIFEFMFVFTKGKPFASLICDKQNKWAGHRDYSGKLKNPVPDYSPRTNIWRYVTSKNSTGHPAPFPVELATDHILTWSQPGDIVYDPFMGSGTTAVAAIQTGRNFLGCEISEEYIDIAQKRITECSLLT